jgi:hypothetical protein
LSSASNSSVGFRVVIEIAPAALLRPKSVPWPLQHLDALDVVEGEQRRARARRVPPSVDTDRGVRADAESRPSGCRAPRTWVASGCRSRRATRHESVQVAHVLGGDVLDQVRRDTDTVIGTSCSVCSRR